MNRGPAPRYHCHHVRRIDALVRPHLPLAGLRQPGRCSRRSHRAPQDQPGQPTPRSRLWHRQASGAIPRAVRNRRTGPQSGHVGDGAQEAGRRPAARGELLRFRPRQTVRRRHESLQLHRIREDARGTGGRRPLRGEPPRGGGRRHHRAVVHEGRLPRRQRPHDPGRRTGPEDLPHEPLRCRGRLQHHGDALSRRNAGGGHAPLRRAPRVAHVHGRGLRPHAAQKADLQHEYVEPGQWRRGLHIYKRS